jgi:hypothetical protein
MSDRSGRGQQLVMRQEIYFLGHGEHCPEYPGVYPDIQAGLLRAMQNRPAPADIS